MLREDRCYVLVMVGRYYGVLSHNRILVGPPFNLRWVLAEGELRCWVVVIKKAVYIPQQ